MFTENIFNQKLVGLISAIVLFLSSNCQRIDDRIIGVKIYDHQGPFEELVSRWRSLGINTVFSGLSLYSNNKFRSIIKSNGITSFVIVPIFFNPEILDVSPELYAITDRGEKAQEEWVKFVCPSRMEYRRQKISEIENIIREFDPDGLSIDFIRHFVFWEKIYPDRFLSSLPNTCFDNSCLTGFQADNHLSIPDTLTETVEMAEWVKENHLDIWTNWKCNLITSMIEEITVAAKKIKPNISINIYIVPWAPDEFDGAIKIVTGQDLAAISPFANYLSPMTYAHMVKQSPSWIHSIVQEMDQITQNEIIPSIQVSEAYLSEPLDAKEFEESLKESLKPPSRGVVFWSWEKLEQDPIKMKILQSILTDGNL